MKRLFKKQGFTLVEMIVVVAIIGIMLGIVVPLLNTNSAREREARENARAFYSNVQELMIDEKLSGTALGGTYTLIYATVAPQPGVSTVPEVKVYKHNSTSISGFSSAVAPVEIAAGDPWEEFAGSLKKLLSSNDQGVNVYYYAVVDDKYRVVISYYSLDTYSEIAGRSFAGDCRVNSASGDQVWTGAYPYAKSVSGETVFG
ncbi:MAG: type II secretion system GspH family protein [Bacteroides sp.]|nr:type II secretion system GspH family protein [Bacteroides sp.]